MAGETLERPGSINDFIEENELLDGPEAHSAYFRQLAEYRKGQAERLGVTPEELRVLQTSNGEVVRPVPAE